MTTATYPKKSGRPRSDIRRANSEKVHRLHSLGRSVAEIADEVGITTQGVEYHTNGRCKCNPTAPGESFSATAPAPSSGPPVPPAEPVLKALGPLIPLAIALSSTLGYTVDVETVDDYFRPIAELYQQKVFPAENPLTIDDVRNSLQDGRLPAGWTADAFTRLTVDLAQAEKKLVEASRLKTLDAGLPRSDVEALLNDIIAHQQSILDRRGFDDWRRWLRGVMSNMESMR